MVRSYNLREWPSRPTNYPDTKIDPNAFDWKTYKADAHEVSYKGR
jgi:hypothetical protein